MDRSELAGSYSLTPEEVTRYSDERSKATGAPKVARLLNGLAALIWLVLGISALATGRGMGRLSICAGLLFAAPFVRRPTSTKLEPGVERTMRFDERGITLEDTDPDGLPWRLVGDVWDFGDLFVFSIRRFRTWIEPAPIVVPKRAFSDNGAAVWRLCERMLLGELRPVSAQLSAGRSGLVRRTDAKWIRNAKPPFERDASANRTH